MLRVCTWSSLLQLVCSSSPRSEGEMQEECKKSAAMLDDEQTNLVGSFPTPFSALMLLTLFAMVYAYHQSNAPEATSTIALSLMMIRIPHSRPACWLAVWLQWQHHPRWHRWRPRHPQAAARGKPPGSGRARRVETTGRPHGHRCWPRGRALSRLSSPRAGRRIDPRDRARHCD